VIAVRGSLVGWGKFERKGTVKVAPASLPKSKQNPKPSTTI
jgi:hypothetical protein